MKREMEHQNVEPGFQKPFLMLSRTRFYLLFLGCLVFPVFSIAFYAVEVQGILFITFLSLLLSAGGGWFLLHLWESKMQQFVSKLVQKGITKTNSSSSTNEISRMQIELDEKRRGYEHQIDLLQSSVAKSKADVHQLNLEMDKKLEEMRLAYLEFEDLRGEYHRLEEDCSRIKEEGRKQVEHKESLNREYQRTIAEQRMILEKKQRYIVKLEGKVGDLVNEIRSLLQSEKLPLQTRKPIVEEYLPTHKSTNTTYDLSLQLQRFVQRAENQMGMDHLGGKSPRFLDLSSSYAVDQRSLFDSFRDETVGIVFILSMREKKFLFVNQQVRAVLGWSPEKFMKEFPHLVIGGYSNWKKALVKITEIREVQSQLVIQSKSGEKKSFACIMGSVARGPFTDHLIGILS